MSQRTVEEYLEAIGMLEEQGSPVSTSSIAQMLGLSLASVSEMLPRLSEKELVVHTRYGGASLTEDGKQRFLVLTRRHRLWEVFLNKYLGIGWEDVYQHACSLEHATSDLVAEKLEEFLNNPEVCPHGNPIPSSDLKYPAVSGVPLTDLGAGQVAKVVRVVDIGNVEFLQHLTSLGLTVGTIVKVLEKAQFDGTLTIEVNNSTKAISPQVASLVMVELKGG